eukprot:15157911-Ditylum_brightwellii.AAC.1
MNECMKLKYDGLDDKATPLHRRTDHGRTNESLCVSCKNRDKKPTLSNDVKEREGVRLFIFWRSDGCFEQLQIN